MTYFAVTWHSHYYDDAWTLWQWIGVFATPVAVVGDLGVIFLHLNMQGVAMVAFGCFVLETLVNLTVLVERRY